MWLIVFLATVVVAWLVVRVLFALVPVALQVVVVVGWWAIRAVTAILCVAFGVVLGAWTLAGRVTSFGRSRS